MCMKGVHKGGGKRWVWDGRGRIADAVSLGTLYKSWKNKRRVKGKQGERR